MTGRCVICGRVGELQLHHALHRLIPFKVPVCTSRHTAWHRLLSSLGWHGGGPAAWSAVLRGFDALVWHLAAFDDDPETLRAHMRHRLAICYRLAALADSLSRDSAGKPARSGTELAAVGERSGDCRIEPPKNVRRGRSRQRSAISLLLRALASILDWAPLTAEVCAVEAPRRLRALDPARLLDGPHWPEGIGDELWSFTAREIAASPTSATLAFVLDRFITTLERL